MSAAGSVLERARCGKRARQQRRGRDIALVHLVPHADGLRHDRPQVNTPARPEGGAEQRTGLARQPVEALQYAGVGGPEAEDLPQSLIDGDVAPGAVAPVLDDEDRHGRRDDPGHGAHRPPLAAGGEANTSPPDEGLRRGVVRRPALIADGAEDRRLHGGACLLPRQGRSGVQDDPPGEAQGLGRRSAIHQDRMGVHQALEGRAIGVPDAHHYSFGSVPARPR